MMGSIPTRKLLLALPVFILALMCEAGAQTPVGGSNIIVDYSVIDPYAPGRPPYYPYAVPAYPTPYGYGYPAPQIYPPVGEPVNSAIQYYPVQPYPAPYGIQPYAASPYNTPLLSGARIRLHQPERTFVPIVRPFDPNAALAPLPGHKQTHAEVQTKAQTQAPAPAETTVLAEETPPVPAPPADVPDSVSPIITEAQPQPATSDEQTAEAPVAADTPSEAPAQEAAPGETVPSETAPAEPQAVKTPAQTASNGEAVPEQQAETQASRQPETPALPNNLLRIVYAPENDELPKEVEAQLNELVSKMQSDEDMRIQVLAYASGTAEAESKARRLSLSRGLNVRAYLINAGIRSTRIEIRALGLKLPDSGPADRVDIVPAAS